MQLLRRNICYLTIAMACSCVARVASLEGGQKRVWQGEGGIKKGVAKIRTPKGCGEELTRGRVLYPLSWPVLKYHTI